MRTRERTCTNPSPVNGTNCTGNYTDRIICNKGPCPGITKFFGIGKRYFSTSTFFCLFKELHLSYHLESKWSKWWYWNSSSEKDLFKIDCKSTTAMPLYLVWYLSEAVGWRYWIKKLFWKCSQNWHLRCPQASHFIKKKIPFQLFSLTFCKNFHNRVSIEHLRTAASDLCYSYWTNIYSLGMFLRQYQNVFGALSNIYDRKSCKNS